jgi:Zn-finger nucleic acid-binding protein
MVVIEADGHAARLCTQCHGMFLSPRAWHALSNLPERVAAIESRYPPKVLPPAALVPLVACPACRAEAERAQFAMVSGVVIDVCSRRHGIWLDSGELGAILRFLQHRDRVGEAGLNAEVTTNEALAQYAFQSAVRNEMAKPHAPLGPDPLEIPDPGGYTPASHYRVIIWVVVLLFGGGGGGYAGVRSCRHQNARVPAAAASAHGQL